MFTVRRLIILGLYGGLLAIGGLGISTAQNGAKPPETPPVNPAETSPATPAETPEEATETPAEETESPAETPAVDPAANLPSFELRRGDRPIVVKQTATDAEGGINITKGGSDCRKDRNISFFYAPNPKRIDTTVNKTRINSSVVLRTQPKEGGAEAQEEADLNFFGGSLGVDNDTLCPTNIKRGGDPKVTITEGRTTVEGGPLVYRNSTGIGDMTGPVDLNRRASGESPALTSSSDRFSFNVDDDIQTLKGNVKVESDGRKSEADILELDEAAGFAVLRGNPAVSRNNESEVRGEVIEYDLDSNDVVVVGEVKGAFTLDLGDDEASLPDLSIGGDSSSTGSDTSGDSSGDTSGATDGSGDSTGDGADSSGDSTSGDDNFIPPDDPNETF